MANGARRAGWAARELPLADGGEGLLEALGGSNRRTIVAGPTGLPIEANWRLDDGCAIIEMARASGLALVGGAERNDPINASTRGTGELIATALESGATSVIVGLGGSATTDGGWGAIDVLQPYAPFQVAVKVACDVETRFLDAALVYARQKGATPPEVEMLSGRLRNLAIRYRRELGVDVTTLPGGGAAGGLAGGLAALGAKLVPGFELVAESVGLDAALAEVDLVITGEGRVDTTSFAGKVVGGVVARAAARDLAVLVVAGDAEAGVTAHVPTISLVERFGSERAFAEAAACIADVVAAEIGHSPTAAVACPACRPFP